jgi:hypothetical protein
MDATPAMIEKIAGPPNWYRTPPAPPANIPAAV